MMKAKPATIRDVAYASGVSTATVSYVLNNGPRRVDPTTRARVEAAMARLQYHPNTMARGLLRKRLNSLGVVFPQPYPGLVADSYFGSILDGIIQTATARRQDVTLFTSLEWHGPNSLPAFRDRRVDGLLLISTLTDSDIVSALTDAGISLVLINGSSNDPRIQTVDVDNIVAVRETVAHLVSLGHRRIALLGGQPNSPSTAPRREGYRKSMLENGLELDLELIVEGLYTKEWGQEGMARLLTLPTPPTAVVAGGDSIAVGACEACRAVGLVVPDDISVVGFDDAFYAAHNNPPLTTVRQPLTEIGAAAATMLLDHIDRIDAEAVDREHPIGRTVFPTKLIVRDSTGPVRTLSSLARSTNNGAQWSSRSSQNGSSGD